MTQKEASAALAKWAQDHQYEIQREIQWCQFGIIWIGKAKVQTGYLLATHTGQSGITVFEPSANLRTLEDDWTSL